MSKELFNEFAAVSSKQWKQQIQYELKGADYNETLVWESPEGIKVKPFYHCDEKTNPLAITSPTSPFQIVQNIYVHDVEKSVARALDTLQRGAESIRFTIPNPDVAMADLLSPIPNTVPIWLHLEFLDAAFVQKTSSFASEKKLTIHFSIDPIGHLAKTGNWHTDLNSDFAQLQNIAQKVPFSFLHCDSTLYQNAGATIVQQLAYTIAHIHEYLHRVAPITNTITIHTAVGTNYFFEIAKLRALRLLFETVASEYNLAIDCHIMATPSKRNKTLYDYNVNMLRTTTECMSAILGGANSVANLAYDAIYHKDNEFGDRIARNQLLVLKNESYFGKVNNPSDGAYYIEELTQQLAEKALTLWKDIEANGGFITQLIEGTIQRKIKESADKEQALFEAGKEILLGTNKYPNPNDRMENDLQLYPFLKIQPRKTLITPILEKRLAEKLEQERLATEKN